MALRDYILCAECETKLIYDGNDSAREWLEERYGDPTQSVYTVKLLCPTCIEALLADAERYRWLRSKVRGIIMDENFQFPLIRKPCGWAKGAIAQHLDSTIDQVMGGNGK